MKQIFLLSLLSTLFFACNNNDKLEGLPTNTENNTLSNNNLKIDSSKILPQPNIVIPNNTELKTSTATTPQNVVSNEVPSATNPPHGQPGHVCGSPTPASNNKTATTAPQSISAPTQTPTNINKATMPAPVATKAGMNPAHGQPGHRCDITAGAPLNSAPKKTEAATMTTPQNITKQINQAATPQAIVNPVPAAKATTAPTVTLAKGTPNPAHGQPGHDCKVTVGQPLP